jgi:hypothetical protein
VSVEAAKTGNLDLLLEPPVARGIADLVRRMGTSIWPRPASRCWRRQSASRSTETEKQIRGGSCPLET